MAAMLRAILAVCLGLSIVPQGRAQTPASPASGMAVFRAYYTDVNAKPQSQAMALGGDINYLTPGEGAKADAINFAVIDRVWNLWKLRVAPSQAK